jgi:hypothetical protein
MTNMGDKTLREHRLICRHFWTAANIHDDALTLHGGGQGFEPPRVHSRDARLQHKATAHEEASTAIWGLLLQRG